MEAGVEKGGAEALGGAGHTQHSRLIFEWVNVRFWLLADSLPHPELLPLYPRKRTFFITIVYVR